MKCPLCNKDTDVLINEIFPAKQDHPGYPDFSCSTMVAPALGKPTLPHYSKHWSSNWGNSFYYENAIIFPFKVTNYYKENKFYSIISKFKDEKCVFTSILRVNSEIHLTNPKDLLEKVKTYLVFS